MRYASQPLYTDEAGHLCFCPSCYPMLRTPEQMHGGHYRREFPNGHADVFERGVPRPDSIAEAVTLDNVPGALVYELVKTGDGSFMLCNRNGHTDIMLRIRYGRDIEIRHATRSMAAD